MAKIQSEIQSGLRTKIPHAVQPKIKQVKSSSPGEIDPQSPCRQSVAKRDCCRKGDPVHGPKLGSCLTLRNELSEETHVLTKQEILGKGTWVKSSRVREPRRTALLRGS